MIMPVSAATGPTMPTFKGGIKGSEVLNYALDNFTRMDSIRWGKIQEAVKSPECPSVFSIYQKVLEIGKTIIKSVVIADRDKVLNEDVFSIKKSGSVLLFSREALSRTILDTIENEINKK